MAALLGVMLAELTEGVSVFAGVADCVSGWEQALRPKTESKVRDEARYLKVRGLKETGSMDAISFQQNNFAATLARTCHEGKF
jgi:hypothetical protein